jgi:hypothetical protein
MHSVLQRTFAKAPLFTGLPATLQNLPFVKTRLFRVSVLHRFAGVSQACLVGCGPQRSAHRLVGRTTCQKTAPDCEASGYLVALSNHVLQRPLDVGKAAAHHLDNREEACRSPQRLGISGHIKCRIGGDESSEALAVLMSSSVNRRMTSLLVSGVIGFFLRVGHRANSVVVSVRYKTYNAHALRNLLFGVSLISSYSRVRIPLPASFRGVRSVKS